MSENKYIIDKDSLTGIANAVRNKLGTGEATTDETTGEIVYPEGKGYYLKNICLAKWETSETTDSWSSTGTSYVRRANVTEEQLLRVCNGVRPVYVKIDTDLTSAGGSIIVENSLTSWSASNHIVTLPTSGRFFCQYSYYHSTYYSGRYFQKTIPAATFSFLDENQEIIIPENASKIVDDSYNRNLLQESVEMPIPYSIDDIQDKITNYLKSKTTIPIDYEGLSYGYIGVGGSSFFSSNTNVNFLTFIPLRAGQKIGFCVGETVSTRLRAGFFQGKTYNNFSYYVMNSSSSSSAVITGGLGITGNSELSGDGLLKRFYYTAPTDGILVVGTSNESKLAYLYVWEVTE